jgi:hypothetical protein
MPPKRTPLAPITHNRFIEIILTSHKRSKIISCFECSQSLDEIALETNTPKSTVRFTIIKETLRTKGKSLPRSGMLKEGPERRERKLARIARL